MGIENTNSQHYSKEKVSHMHVKVIHGNDTTVLFYLPRYVRKISSLPTTSNL